MKKFYLCILIIVLNTLLLAGCSEKDSDAADSSETSAESEEIVFGVGVFDIDPLECVKLPEYKGLELTRESTEVTDEYLNEYLAALPDAEPVDDENAEVEEGDVVNINYTGYVNGEEFEGGSADDYDLQIGSNAFIDGFEEGLIGYKAGDEVTLDLSFPDDYWSSDLAGSAVVFDVVINSISKIPEITDEWVKEYTLGEYETVEEYSEYIKEILGENLQTNAESDLMEDAWDEVFENTEFLEIPQNCLDMGSEVCERSVETEAEYYGYSLDEYLEAYDISDEYFEEYKASYAESYAQIVVFAAAVLENEGLSYEGDEIEAYMEDLGNEWGMTVEEMKEQFGENELYCYAISYMANEIFLDNAVITDE